MCHHDDIKAKLEIGRNDKKRNGRRGKMRKIRKQKQ
jgi:hypothetical protein